MIKLGKDLKIGDVIEVYWIPGKDEIIGLSEYTDNRFGDSKAKLASFVFNKVGMTIESHIPFIVITKL